MSLDTLDRVRAGRRPLERCTGDPRSFLADDWGKRAAVRLGGSPPRRLRGPALARRRRPVPHDGGAPHAVLPAREGRRADPGVLVHPIGSHRLPRGLRHRGSRARRGALRRRRDDRPPRSPSLVRAGRTLLSRPRAGAGTPLPGQRLHHAPGRPGTRPPRGRARRLRPPSVRPQALGGARRATRGEARSPRGRGHLRRDDLHAGGHAPLGPRAGRAVGPPHRRRPRDSLARGPHGCRRDGPSKGSRTR